MIEKEKTKSKAEKEETQEDWDNKEKEEKVKTPSMVGGAILAAEELKRQNDRKEELLNREEELQARKELEGRAEAGTQPVKPKQESDIEYADRVKRGEANPLKDDGFI